MTIYCSKCNQPTNYLDIKPKFCSNCAKPFASINLSNINIPTNNTTNLTKPTLVIRQEIEDNEKEIYSGQINVSPFKVEIINDGRNSEKLGSLAIDKSPKFNVKREKIKKVSKKEFEQNWKDDLTKKSSINIGGE